MPYLGACGSSQARGLDVFARKNSPIGPVPYHRYDHTDCLFGGDLDRAAENIRKIAEVRVASFPGLDIPRLYRKVCYAGPYMGMTLPGFLETICADPEFIGTLAMILLGNDEEWFRNQTSATLAVKNYLSILGNLFSTVPNFQRVKLFLVTTVLHRKSDFCRNNAWLLRKKQNFNSHFLESQTQEGYELSVNGRVVPYKVIDMGEFLPFETMHLNTVYCAEEHKKYISRRCTWKNGLKR